MDVEGFTGLKASFQASNLTQVIIYDDFKQPIAIVSNPANGCVQIIDATDAGFYDALDNLRIKYKKLQVIKANG